jgi:dTDP-glucose 4,6-dehydratase
MLVTGGAGFIGSNFIRYMLFTHKNYEITNLDKLTYAGNLNNLKDLEHNANYHFVHGSICDRELVQSVLKNDIEYIINFAAESHVDRSISDPSIFLTTNVLGSQILMDCARESGIKRFIQISTDEVYGSIDGEGSFTENSPLNPNSPYSASKASADLIAHSYFKTYNFPAIVTRSTNNYGIYQFPEKLIPLMIIKAFSNERLPVYGDGQNVRDWIHVLDHCRAIDVVLHRGEIGEIYNIGANNEVKNIEIVEMILNELKRPRTLIEFVRDRAAHDKRYAINNRKIIEKLGWKPVHSFQEGIRATIRWYIDNKPWWKNILSGEYKSNIYNCLQK